MVIIPNTVKEATSLIISCIEKTTGHKISLSDKNINKIQDTVLIWYENTDMTSVYDLATAVLVFGDYNNNFSYEEIEDQKVLWFMADYYKILNSKWKMLI